jgi:pyridoxal 5'-phosphate synthase pdxT subunit
MKIGVLAVQGAFREHELILKDLGCETVLVKLPEHLEGLDGLVFPGGESTSMGKLMREYDLISPIRDMAAHDVPMFGTCAGMIIMANRITGGEEPHLGIMDVEVNRNSFGRQVDSFETDLDMPAVGVHPFPAVFIRAPHIQEVGKDTEALAKYKDRVVAVQHGNLLATSFHPELTSDNRIHAYFLDLIRKQSK